MTHLEEGDKAPKFKEIQEMAGVSGKKIILFFYPKDNTPGCTAEACDLRDNYADLTGKGFEVIGASPDNDKSHEKFTTKFDLPYFLIPDTEKEILEAYGVWGLKKMYGREYMGVFRTTFVMDTEGTILKIFKKVKTKEHTAQILAEFPA